MRDGVRICPQLTACNTGESGRWYNSRQEERQPWNPQRSDIRHTISTERATCVSPAAGAAMSENRLVEVACRRAQLALHQTRELGMGALRGRAHCRRAEGACCAVTPALSAQRFGWPIGARPAAAGYSSVHTAEATGWHTRLSWSRCQCLLSEKERQVFAEAFADGFGLEGVEAFTLGGDDAPAQ